MKVIEPGADHKKNILTRRDELQSLFETTYEIGTEGQRTKAEELLSQIGSVDFAIEGYKSSERQRDLSIKFVWGHDHRFAEDINVPGQMKDRHLMLISEFYEGFGIKDSHFKDRDVLDVGCWTGGTTLTLKMLGAKKVHAIEEVKKYAYAAKSLCCEIYGFNDVEVSATSLYNFEESKFDTIYFPGVVYHLSDPVLGLRRLYNRLHDGGDIFVESFGIFDDGQFCRFDSNIPNGSGNKSDLNRSGWNWFVPSAKCLGAWMEVAGFEDVEVFASNVTGYCRVFGHGRRKSFKDITRAGLAVPDIE
ncbi:DUF1698 domain-containing protein [Thalassovita sp.]|uniref:DUF1698 domain-containing protein n=1 Tax=Thalassovita sp. TaxID=1979401 RepID=UPI002B2732D4|nr:DUF1698 domain-containing protein [Thalassovita sp.]